MKAQKALFKVGDIITNNRNDFKRIIRGIRFEERSGMLKVMYLYSSEEFDEKYHLTGNFHPLAHGYCSQDHLRNWKSGRN